VKLVLRAIAIWILLVSAAVLLVTSERARALDTDQHGIGGAVEPFRASEAEVRGAWIFCSVGVAAAIELWRLRKAGLLLASCFLLYLVIGGCSKILHGIGDQASIIAVVIHTIALGQLLRPQVWRFCKANA
jgi:hypothetical protein